MYIARARRQIDKEIVQIAPIGLLYKLFDSITCHYASPYDSTLGVDEETDRQQLDSKLFGRSHIVFVAYRHEFGTIVFETEHLRHRRTENIGIEQSHTITFLGKSHSQIRRNGRFTDSAFTRRNSNNLIGIHCRRLLCCYGSHLFVFHIYDHFALFADMSFDSCLRSFYYRFHKRRILFGTYQRKRYLVAVDTYVVFDHTALHNILWFTGVTYLGECL